MMQQAQQQQQQQMMQQQQQQQQQQAQQQQQQRYRSISLQPHPNNFGGGMPNQPFQPGMAQGGVPYRQQNINQIGPGMRAQQMGARMGGPMSQGMLLSQVGSPPPMGGPGPVRSPNPGQSPRGPMGGMVPSPHTPPHQQYQTGMQGIQVQQGDSGDVNGSSHNVMMNNVMPNMNDMGMGGAPGGPGQDHSSQSMTPQDQLSEFVKTL